MAGQGEPGEDSSARFARTVRGPAERLGSGFMISPEAAAVRTQTGLRGWEVYFAGRCGVLGDVDADVVTASAVFFPPARVRPLWDASGTVESRARLVDRYAEAAHAWGLRRLDRFPAADRLAELLEPLVAVAPATAAPLFAGWRALPLPADGPARVVHLLQVLREHRGAMHGVAVLACGLTPLEAILSGPEGVAGARYFGWPDPFPIPSPAVRAARVRAERLTDALEGPVWARLGDQAEECVQLLKSADAQLR
ncbi:MAG: hypothetical protein ABI170_03350 [Microbacteriaceae bacterium]